MKSLRYRIIGLLFAIVTMSNARVFSPGVAETIVRRGLQEFEKTKNIKKLNDFKQAYKDMSLYQKENYVGDYQDTISAIEKKHKSKSSSSSGFFKTKTLIDPKDKEIKFDFIEKKILTNQNDNDNKLQQTLIQQEKSLEEKRLEKQEKQEKQRLEKEKLEKEQKEKLEKEQKRERKLIIYNKTQQDIVGAIYLCDQRIQKMYFYDENDTDQIGKRLLSDIKVSANSNVETDYNLYIKKDHKTDDTFTIPYFLFKTTDSKKDLNDYINADYLYDQFIATGDIVKIEEGKDIYIKTDINSIDIDNKSSKPLKVYKIYRRLDSDSVNPENPTIIKSKQNGSIDCKNFRSHINKNRYLVFDSLGGSFKDLKEKIDLDALRDKLGSTKGIVRIEVTDTGKQISFDQGEKWEDISQYLMK